MHEVDTKDLLRFLTAGSVDDGKSTMIGRLLFESQAIYDDQLASVRKFSAKKGAELDLSLITDGLRIEREQAITVDVAYRYFSTAKRKFIIADTPGHEQYTRNMATGASTADAAVILIDARKGVLEQTRRHAYITALLGIKAVVVAVNKMDLVNFDCDVFLRIRDEYLRSTRILGVIPNSFVPISALAGDNIVTNSNRMPWYEQSSLLDILENIPVSEPYSAKPFRFPIQTVVRPNQDYRGYAGQIASGRIRPGDRVLALPSLQATRVEEVRLYHTCAEEACCPMSVMVSLSEHLDLGRGDMLVCPDHPPMMANQVIAQMMWFCDEPLKRNFPYLIRHTSQTVCGSVTRIFSKIDMRSLLNVEWSNCLGNNEIGSVSLQLHKPIFVDPYSSNRATGSFIVIDPTTNDTVAAGIVTSARDGLDREEDVFGQDAGHLQLGMTLWFTGRAGSVKSSVADGVCTELLARGFKVEILDDEVIRKQLASDPKHNENRCGEALRIIGLLAQLLNRHGVVVLVTARSPGREIRAQIHPKSSRFVEVLIDTPVDHQPRAEAPAVDLHQFSGLDDGGELPPNGGCIVCNTHRQGLRACVDTVIRRIIASHGQTRNGQTTVSDLTKLGGQN